MAGAGAKAALQSFATCVARALTAGRLTLKVQGVVV